MTDPILTEEQLLEEVRRAIVQVLTRGQDVSIAGKRYSRAQLGELRQLKTELEQSVARTRRRGIRTRRVVPFG